MKYIYIRPYSYTCQLACLPLVADYVCDAMQRLNILYGTFPGTAIRTSVEQNDIIIESS